MDLQATRRAIHGYIGVLYNGKRNILANGFLSPVERERRFDRQAPVAVWGNSPLSGQGNYRVI